MLEQNTMNSPFFLHKVIVWSKRPSDTISTQKLDMLKQNIATVNHVMPYQPLSLFLLLSFTSTSSSYELWVTSLSLNL